MKKVEEINPIEQLLDEKNTDNIILYNENDEPFEFEQIALIPLDQKDGSQKLYAILLPVNKMEGIGEDEAITFELDEEKEVIRVCEDNKVIDEVLAQYEKLVAEEE